jgi:hypothetical protein
MDVNINSRINVHFVLFLTYKGIKKEIIAGKWISLICMYWFVMFVNNLRINYLSTYLRPPLLSLATCPKRFGTRMKKEIIATTFTIFTFKKRQQSYNRKTSYLIFNNFLGYKSFNFKRVWKCCSCKSGISD